MNNVVPRIVPHRRHIGILLAAAAFLIFTVPFLAHAQEEEDDSKDWNFSGDFRVRYERTTNQAPTPEPLILDPRNRGVVRFRAGATKKFNDMLQFGVRLATGSRDDPNSTDITLGGFSDGLEVSLDRAYVELRHEGAFLTGGKFPNPFTRTDLVWDGDVNPQGVGGSLTAGSDQVTGKVTAVYYIVDEQTVRSDSTMLGAQGQITARPSPNWTLTFSGGYYDYAIESLSNANAGDTRSNRLTEDRTAYVSDFDLLDGIVSVQHATPGSRFPVRFVGDFVRNLGADDENEGYMLDFFVGKTGTRGDTRVRYGLARNETDAVLAAFSNDNTTLATNYKQHTATLDHQALDDLQLNATWYLYRALRGEPDRPWIWRLRLNALVSF